MDRALPRCRQRAAHRSRAWQERRRPLLLRAFRHRATTSMSTVDRKPLGPLPALIFSSRWLQLPLYLGLIVAQGVYVFLFLKELWHLIHSAPTLTEQ